MSDAKRAGANAESTPLNLRLPHHLGAQLEALATDLPIVSKHRLAVEALRLGLAALAADPSILLRGAATPAQTAPAAPAAPAPSRPVASPAAPAADPRQPALFAPAAPVVLHTSPSGASVATVTGNDNDAAPAAPKRTRATSPAATLDAATIGARLRALRAAEVARGVPLGSREWSLRSAAERAGVSPPTIDKLMKGERVRPEYVAKVAPILPPE